jgi:hypothetical protein
MPTPFTHLAMANQLRLNLPAFSPTASALIEAYLPAFYLGSVAADAKIAGQGRDATHFYEYTRPMQDEPWRVMLSQYPSLARPQSNEWRAFVAGYAAHLAADAHWSRAMLAPHFAKASWGESGAWRFYVLHFLLTAMDERDHAQLTGTESALLSACAAQDWLPFMPHPVLLDWRDFIAEQLTDVSQTVPIFASRIGISVEEMRAVLDSPSEMQSLLWDNVTPATLADIEQEMFRHALEQLLCYIAESE